MVTLRSSPQVLLRRERWLGWDEGLRESWPLLSYILSQGLSSRFSGVSLKGRAPGRSQTVGQKLPELNLTLGVV